jgi:hypothetical protein
VIAVLKFNQQDNSDRTDDNKSDHIFKVYSLSAFNKAFYNPIAK